MKTTIDKEFFEKWKDKDVVMWCKKEEYAEEFCRLMDEQGLRWGSDESYLSENNWDNYTTKTTYNFNKGVFADKRLYKNGGYTILDFEDYIVKSYAEDISNQSKKSGEIAGDAFSEFLRKTAVIDFSKRLDLADEVIDSGNGQSTNNLPAHYNIAGIDTMDLILTICEHNNTNQRETFYLANTLKYLIRFNNKNGIDDLEKAKDYLNRLIEQKTMEDLPFYDVDGQGD